MFGQFEDQGTSHYYTYPQTPPEELKGWKSVMTDPRNELTPRINQCYVTWCTATDWWVAKLIKNPHDARGGFAMVSVCLGPNRPANGYKAAMALDQFVDVFIVQKKWSDEEASRMIMNYEPDFNLVPCAPKRFADPSTSLNAAYRTYSSSSELEECLTFLPQNGYEKFSRIYFVPKEDAMGMPVECLDSILPIKRIYAISYPEGCTSVPFRSEIMEGETMTIVYSKDGMGSVEKRIKCGENSDYAFVQGKELVVRSAKEVGIRFNKTFEVKCVDKDGRSISPIRVENYTRQYTSVVIDGNKVSVPEDFSEEIVLEIRDLNNNYTVRRESFVPAKQIGSQINVTMEKKEYTVCFRLNGQEYPSTETISANSEQYRTISRDYDCESYSDSKKLVVKVHRKSTSANTSTSSSYDEPEGFLQKYWKILIHIPALLIMGYAVYAIIASVNGNQPWPFKAKQATVVTETTSTPPAQTISSVTETQQPAENQEVNQVDPEKIAKEQRDHDIAYLKEADVWVLDSIQSESFQVLYKRIVDGDIDYILQNNDELFKDVKVNGYWNKIVGDCKTIKGYKDDSCFKEAQLELQNASKNGVDLKAIRLGLKGVDQRKKAAMQPATPKTQESTTTGRPDSSNP